MSRAAKIWTEAPHLSATFIAIAVTGVLLMIGLRVLHIERRLAYLTAPEMLPVKDEGLTLQENAFKDKHLLPVYGSSEFRSTASLSGRRFFSTAPTGFKIFIVGQAGAKTLIVATRIGALGKVVRGKKVVIILSPTWFLETHEGPNIYAGNFSALQASELMFDSPLSIGLKRAFAREFLKYPDTLAGHCLLKLELQRTAEQKHAFADRLLSHVGRSSDYFQGLFDQAETVFSLSGDIAQNSRAFFASENSAKQKPDWDRLLEKAEKSSERNSYESVIDGQQSEAASVAEHLYSLFKGPGSVPFETLVDRSDEWVHLDILLRTLRELGAKPLFISIPVNATSFAKMGVTSGQLDYFYTRLKQKISSFNFPIETFSKYQGDPAFFNDSLGHPSVKGWVLFNQTISNFYHGKLPSQLD